MRPFWPIPTRSGGWSECIWLCYSLLLVGHLQNLCIFYMKLPIVLEPQHQSYLIPALFPCCHSCLSDREAIKAKQWWLQAADSEPEPRFLSPCKLKLGFYPLADAIGRLQAFGICYCMECYPLLVCSPTPWPRCSRRLCTHPASTTTSYSDVVDSRARLPTFERGRSRTVYMYPQRCRTIQEKQPKHQAEIRVLWCSSALSVVLFTPTASVVMNWTSSVI